MSDLVKSLTKVIRIELEKPEYKQQILEPVTRWIFSSIWPYALGIISLNFFMTIAAVSLVLYFTTMKPKFSTI
jgi:hypothetical protein